MAKSSGKKSSGKAGALFFGMTLDTGDFKKRIKDVKKSLKSAGEEMRETLSAISTGFTVVGTAVAAGATGILAFTKATAEANNEQILLANSIGATQSEIAGLQLATDRWGVESDMVIDKMREFGGIDEFKKLADDVKNAGDEQAQLNKAVELFGGEGAKMLTVLQLGSDGLSAMEQEARDLGLALSPQQIEQNNVAWGQFEDTLLKLKGLGKQIGTGFLEFFGTASAGVEGLIDAFGVDLKAAFKNTSEFLVNSMLIAFDWFKKNGIPFINGFINAANNIGEAFGTIFDFIMGKGDSTFSFIGDLFTGFIDFMATFKQSIIAGVTGSISTVIKGAFGLLAKFNTFVGEQVEGLAALVQMIPGVSKDLAKNVREAFQDQSKSIEDFGAKLAKPFAEVSEENINEAAEILKQQKKKNEEQAKKFINPVDEILSGFLKAGEVTKQAAKDNKKTAAAVANLSTERAVLAQTGTQEEFRIRQGAKQTEIAAKQLSEQKKLRLAIERIGTA